MRKHRENPDSEEMQKMQKDTEREIHIGGSMTPIPEKSSVGKAHECPFGCHHNINELQAYRVELEAALKGLMKLLDDGDLVRKTDGDGDAMVFLRQGVKITNAIKTAQDLLLKEKI